MTNTNREKLRAHWPEWRGFYIGVAVGVVLAGITLLVVRGISSRTVQGAIGMLDGTGSRALPVAGGETTGSVSFNNPVHTVNIYNGTSGHPGFLTRCIETGEVFTSQRAAARAFGIHERDLGKHLNTGRELLEGLHFERLGVIG